jgi:hypothetical protein
LDTTSQLGDDEGQCEENEREEEEEERESTDAIDIRQNAAKLLQWANYRTSVRTISVPGKVTKDQDEDSATESYSQSDRSGEHRVLNLLQAVTTSMETLESRYSATAAMPPHRKCLFSKGTAMIEIELPYWLQMSVTSKFTFFSFQTFFNLLD